MPARLVPLIPGHFRPIVLESPVILIGRHQECDAILPHSRISRRHCCIAQIAGGLVIRDLESRTGTRINGHAVEEASIEEGDEVAIGPIVFRLEGEHVPLDAPSPPSKSPQPAPPKLDPDDLVPLEDD